MVKAEYDIDYAPDARFTHALFLLGLEKSGVHFNLDDLDADDWQHLGELKNAIHQEELKQIKSN